MGSDTTENVVKIHNFISDQDCDYLIQTYSDKVFKSVVVGGQVHQSRTSSTYYIPHNDPVISKIRVAVSEYLKIPESHIEGIQFLRYMKGERYLYHYDYLTDLACANQRVHTIIAYLNSLDVQDGGATSFFHYGLKVQPVKGMGVWFKNMNDDGSLNRDSLHAGEEILTDGVVKYALNIWTRQSPN
jgi:prolyl 4-hydroxylase